MECFGKVVLLLFLDGFTICRSVLIATTLGISPFIQFQWWMFHVKIINIWSHHSTACVYDTQIIEYNCMLVFLSSFYLVAYLSINHIQMYYGCFLYWLPQNSKLIKTSCNTILINTMHTQSGFGELHWRWVIYTDLLGAKLIIFSDWGVIN